VHPETEGAEEGVLRTFDEAEKIREVHDPCEISVGELDHPLISKMKRRGGVHAGAIRRWRE
jgi:hypothetical protein